MGMVLFFAMSTHRQTLFALAAVFYVLPNCLAQLLFDPTILRPGGADVWTVGDVETVKW